jgi:hypothetical protein
MNDNEKYEGPEAAPETDELTPDDRTEAPQPSGPEDSNR